MRYILLLTLLPPLVSLGCASSDPVARVQPAIVLCAGSPGSSTEENPPPKSLQSECPETPRPSQDVLIGDIFTTECALSNEGYFTRSTGPRPICFYKQAYVFQQNVEKADMKGWPSSTPTPSDRGPAAADPAAARSTAPASPTSPSSSAEAAAPRSAPTPDLPADFKQKRHEVIQQLINVSDSNCNNFMGRLFASETGSSFARALVNVVSSATAAVTGFISVPTAAAMNAGNIAAGGGLDAVNSNIYYSKTAPDIAMSILNKRQQIRAEIAEREAGKSTVQAAASAADEAKAKAKSAATLCEDKKKTSDAAGDAAGSRAIRGKANGSKAAAGKASVSDARGDAIAACTAANEADSAARDADYAAGKAASAQSQSSLQPLAGPYMISDGIRDVIEYDSYCSMLGGLMSLSSAVNAQAKATTPGNEAQQQATSARLSADRAASKAQEAGVPRGSGNR